MKFTPVVLPAVFAAIAQAGNVCVAGQYGVSRVDIQKVMAFAAGAPCEDGKRTVTEAEVIKLCDELPLGINVCGKNGNLIKISHGPEADPGCQIGLEIDGKVYTGETDKYNPDDANKDGPCDASCGLTEGIDGFLEFVGVPMC